MKLEELNVYNLAMELGERIWDIVTKWDYFSNDTIGRQLVKAVDSIAANISEGFGRYHYKDKKNFYYYSRGSLFETKTWLLKAYNRKLLNENDFQTFQKEIEILGVKLNNYINSIGKTTNNYK
ncbi:MAG: four helix bundle protein [Candidatus Marinimicrobia bacterium]|nr:four helix bundle protein [bacterium]MCG2716463.1 four helix bundle protein [Candidatus Neomarinimicrobiota bacterium]